MTTNWGTSTDGFHEWEQDYSNGDANALSVASGKGSVVVGASTGNASMGMRCVSGVLDTWRTGAALWSGRFALPVWSADATDIYLDIIPWDREADSPSGYIGFDMELTDDTGLGVVNLWASYDGESVSVTLPGLFPLTAPAMGDGYLRAELGVWFDPALMWLRLWADGDPRPAYPTIVAALPFSAMTATALRLDPSANWVPGDPQSAEFLFDYWRYAAIDASDVPACPIDDFERTAGPMDWGTSSSGPVWGTVEEKPLSGALVVDVSGGAGRIYPTAAAGGQVTAAAVPLPFTGDPNEFLLTAIAHLVPNLPDCSGAGDTAAAEWRVVLGDGSWDWPNQATNGDFLAILSIEIRKDNVTPTVDPASTLTVRVWDESAGGGFGNFVDVFSDTGILSLAPFRWTLDRSIERGTMVVRLDTGAGGEFDSFEYEFATNAQVPAGPMQLWIEGFGGAVSNVADYTPQTTNDDLAGCM